MPYKQKIKNLEESHRLITVEIEKLRNDENKDMDKFNKLVETRNKYLSDLREFRRAQHEFDHERVDFDDDR